MKRLAAVLLLALAPSIADARGLTARPCGLDINRNSVFGEATGDCNLCDGVAGNPDASTLSEWYVDASQALSQDESTCGTTGNPCTTCQYALNTRGPSTGVPDVCCLKGTDTKEPTGGISIPAGGAGTYSFDATSVVGARVDWTLAVAPTMIVAWDTDNDGDYSDETAIIDSCTGQQTFGITFPAGAARIELAHIRIKDNGNVACVGASTLTTRGAFMFNNAPDHVFIHDCIIENINRGQVADDDNAAFRIFFGNNGGADGANSIIFWNNYMLALGSYGFRGGVGISDPDDGPIVFDSNTVTWHGAAGSNGRIAEIFGKASGLYFRNNIFDSRSGAWGASGNGPNVGFAINNCSRNWFIEQNEFVDWKSAIESGPDTGGGGSGACVFTPPRAIENVTIDANVIRKTSTSAHATNSKGMAFSDGGPAQCITGSEAGTDNTCTTNADCAGSGTCDNFTYTAGLTITNNFIDLGTARACIQYEDAMTDAGACTRADTVVIENNTCRGDWSSSYGAINLGPEDQPSMLSCTAGTVKIKNNGLMGLSSSDRAVRVDAAYVRESTLDIDNNAADPIARYACNGVDLLTLSQWQSSPCAAASDMQCVAVFAGAGDDHLGTADTCLRDAGINTSADGVTRDRDGRTRPIGSRYDVGSQEAVAASADPGAISFSADAYSITETGTTSATLNLSVCRSGGTVGAASVIVRNQTGASAVAGTCPTNDYATFSPTSVAWIAGQGGCQNVPVTVCNDTVVENPETVLFYLDTVAGATIGTISATVATIVDNDTAGGSAPFQYDNAHHTCATLEPSGGNTATVSETFIDGAPSTATKILIAHYAAAGTGATGDPSLCDPASAVLKFGNTPMVRGYTSGNGYRNDSGNILCEGVFYLLSAGIEAECSTFPCTRNVTVTLGGTANAIDLVTSKWLNVLQAAPDLGQAIPYNTTGVISLSSDFTSIAALSHIVAGVALSSQVTYTPSGTATLTGAPDFNCDTLHHAVQGLALPTITTQASGGSWTGASPKRAIQTAVILRGIPPTCTPTCGNQIKECNEVCDNDSTPPTAGDGCSDTCTVESGWTCNAAGTTCTPICGDGVDVGAAEACDDGNRFDNDCCTNVCTVATCGDGHLCSAPECASCTPALVDGVEECDVSNDSQCSAGCDYTTSPTCNCNAPAPVTQACCHPEYGAACAGAVCCADQDATNCLYSGGVAQGVGTDCSPNPCTAPPTTVVTPTLPPPTTTLPEIVSVIHPPIKVGNQYGFDFSTPPPLPSLPIVEVTDGNSDGQYNQTDVDLAMAICDDTQGCNLRFLPNTTYKEIALTIDASPNLSNGIAIFGDGGSTVIEPHIRTSASDDYKPVFWINTGAPASNVLFQDLIIDGRTDLQKPFGECDSADSSRHGAAAIKWEATSYNSGAEIPVTNHVARRLTIRDFLAYGIFVSNFQGVVVEDNTISDVGCITGLITCSAEYMACPDLGAGKRASGACMQVHDDADNTIVRRNHLARSTYTTLEVFADGTNCSADYTPKDVLIEDNDLTGLDGFVMNGGCRTIFQNNTIHDIRFPGNEANSASHGIAVYRGDQFKLLNNTITNVQGNGIHFYNTVNPSGTAEYAHIMGNTIIDPCMTWTQTCTPIVVGGSAGYENIVVANNIIQTNNTPAAAATTSYNGIWVLGGTHVAVYNNNVEGRENGVLVQGTDVDVFDNTFRRVSSEGTNAGCMAAQATASNVYFHGSNICTQDTGITAWSPRAADDACSGGTCSISGGTAVCTAPSEYGCTVLDCTDADVDTEEPRCGSGAVTTTLPPPGTIIAPPFPALPIVDVVDSNADGQYNMTDINAAMAICDNTDGCNLQLLPNTTYKNVALSIGSATNVDNGFAIYGDRLTSVLESHISNGTEDHTPTIAIGAGAPTNLIIQDITLDGRNDLQVCSSSDDDGAGPEVAGNCYLNDQSIGYSDGIRWDRASGSQVVNHIVRRVNARRYLLAAMECHDFMGITIENSLIENNGCQTGLTTNQCHSSWMNGNNDNNSITGLKMASLSIFIGDYCDNAIVRNNTVRTATKIAIEVMSTANATVKDCAAADISKDVLIEYNDVGPSSGDGITLNGSCRTTIQHNNIHDMATPGSQPKGQNWDNGIRMPTTDQSRILYNTITNVGYQGIESLVIQSAPDSSSYLYVYGNVITDPCQDNTQTCAGLRIGNLSLSDQYPFKVIANNTVRYNTLPASAVGVWGIWGQRIKNTGIWGNTIEGQESGITLYDTENVDIWDNDFIRTASSPGGYGENVCMRVQDQRAEAALNTTDTYFHASNTCTVKSGVAAWATPHVGAGVSGWVDTSCASSVCQVSDLACTTGNLATCTALDCSNAAVDTEAARCGSGAVTTTIAPPNSRGEDDQGEDRDGDDNDQGDDDQGDDDQGDDDQGFTPASTAP